MLGVGGRGGRGWRKAFLIIGFTGDLWWDNMQNCCLDEDDLGLTGLCKYDDNDDVVVVVVVYRRCTC